MTFLSALLAVAFGAQSGNLELLAAGIAVAAVLFGWLTAKGRRYTAFEGLQMLFLGLVLASMMALGAAYLLLLRLVPGAAAWLRGIDPTLLWLLALFASFGLATALGLRWQRRLLRLAVASGRPPRPEHGRNG